MEAAFGVLLLTNVRCIFLILFKLRAEGGTLVLLNMFLSVLDLSYLSREKPPRLIACLISSVVDTLLVLSLIAVFMRSLMRYITSLGSYLSPKASLECFVALKNVPAGLFAPAGVLGLCSPSYILRPKASLD